jgi:ABC-type glycerol-3-phosphate transport system permease component
MLIRTRREKAISVIVYILLVCFSLYVLVPLFWAVSTSLKDPVAIYSTPPKLIPNPAYFENYVTKFFLSKFLRYLFNSLLVAMGTILLSEFVAFLAAYAASRYSFKGKEVILFMLWATIMIPGISVIVPLYLIAMKLKLYDTFTILILVYSAWLIPTMTWLFKGFIDNIPSELEESAIIDGCPLWKAIYHIILPLARPGLAAAAVLGFVIVWNDFLRSYSLTISDSHRTVQAGLYQMITDWGVEWGPMMAATVTALVPIIVIFIILQKSFIQGLTAGSMKS